jgi:hypothetical protein
VRISPHRIHSLCSPMIRSVVRPSLASSISSIPAVFSCSARSFNLLSERLTREVRRPLVSSCSSQRPRTFSAAAAPKKAVDFKDPKYKKYVKLAPGQRLIILGFGAIGQGVLPLLYRHIDMSPDQVTIISNEFNETQLAHAADYGAKTAKHKLTRTEYLPALKQLVKKGDFLINVSIDVSSVALIEHCQVKNEQFHPNRSSYNLIKEYTMIRNY